MMRDAGQSALLPRDKRRRDFPRRPDLVPRQIATFRGDPSESVAHRDIVLGYAQLLAEARARHDRNAQRQADA
jgi:hypothetical protein